MVRLVLDLPEPPSTNGLFIQAGRRRVPVKEYEAWQRDALRAIGYRQTLEPPYKITILIGKCNQARDGDNFLKPLLDILGRKKAGVIVDDNLKNVVECTYRKAFGIAPDKMVRIIIE